MFRLRIYATICFNDMFECITRFQTEFQNIRSISIAFGAHTLIVSFCFFRSGSAIISLAVGNQPTFHIFRWIPRR